jgi:hypothetical protein
MIRRSAIRIHVPTTKIAAMVINQKNLFQQMLESSPREDRALRELLQGTLPHLTPTSPIRIQHQDAFALTLLIACALLSVSSV